MTHARTSTRRWLLWLGLITAIGAITVLGAGDPAWAGPSEAQTVPTRTKSPTAGLSPTVTATPSPVRPTATPSPVRPTATPGHIRPTATGATPRVSPTPGGDPCRGDDRALGSAQLGGPWSLGRRAARIWLFAWPGRAGEPALACRITLSAVAAHRLPAPPAGWRLAASGARLTGWEAGGQPLATEARGLLICFQRPAGPPPAGGWSVAVVDEAAAPGGWTHLPTRALGGAVCGVSGGPPATLALLAGPN